MLLLTESLGRREALHFWLLFALLAVAGPFSNALPDLVTGLTGPAEFLSTLDLRFAITLVLATAVGAMLIGFLARRAANAASDEQADTRFLLFRGVTIAWGVAHNVGMSVVMHHQAPFIEDAIGIVLVSLYSGAVGMYFAIMLITGSGNDIEKAAARTVAGTATSAGPDTAVVSKRRFTGLTSKLFVNVTLGILAFLVGGIAVSYYGIYAGNGIAPALVGALITAFPFQVLTLVLVYFLSRVFARPMVGAVQPLRDLQNRNLQTELQIPSRDEIGQVFQSLNGFIGAMRESVRNSANAAGSNLERSSELDSRVSEQDDALKAMQESLAAVGEHVKELSAVVEESASASEEMTRTISSLDEQISSQTSMVMETLSAAEEMAESVNNVASISGKRRDAAQQLVESSKQSRNKLDQAIQATREVTDGVDELQNINQLISRVSAQTNLLAMNAAIEAAHAGDAGRGFSVVAEEIRNLATSSSEHSKQTTEFLKRMVQSITATAEAIEEVAHDFDNVQSESGEAAASLQEIASAASEISEGAMQIREQMTSLSDLNKGIASGSSEMKRGIEEIASGNAQARTAVQEVQQDSHSIDDRARELAEAAGRIGEAAAGLRSEAEGLNKELSTFTV